MPIVELAVAVSGKAAVGVIGPLLRDLLEVQDQHTRALDALQSDLRGADMTTQGRRSLPRYRL